MANILVNIEKGITVAAEDVLKFIGVAQKEITVAPAAAAALGTVLGAVSTAIADASRAASASGLNILLDEQTVVALKAVWPDVEAFLKTIGVTL